MVGQVRAYGPWDTRQQRSVRFVYSEDDWRRAITSIIKQSTADGERRQSSGGIVFGGPFTVSRPLMLPAGCGGLTIVSPTRFPIRAVGVVDCLFDVRVNNITIVGVLAYATGPSASDYFTSFCKTSTSACTMTRIRDCEAWCDRLFVDDGTSGGHRIIDCDQFEINSTHSIPVVFGSSGNTVRGCFISGGAEVGVSVEAAAAENSIVDNRWTNVDAGGLGCVNSALSAGSNVITGNRGELTVTAHASDAVANNT